MKTSQTKNIITLLVLLMLGSGCALPRTISESFDLYDRYYCLAGSQRETLSKAYRYKNPQPTRNAPHRFVVCDRYTGREFGIVLRGLKVSQDDPDMDKFTDMQLDSSFFHARDIYLLKSSIENLPNGDIKAVAYVLGQSSVHYDLATGESIMTPIW